MDYLCAPQFVCRGGCVRSASGDNAHKGTSNSRAVCEFGTIASAADRRAAAATQSQPRRGIRR
jgi:hypothetical protein